MDFSNRRFLTVGEQYVMMVRFLVSTGLVLNLDEVPL